MASMWLWRQYALALIALELMLLSIGNIGSLAVPLVTPTVPETLTTSVVESNVDSVNDTLEPVDTVDTVDTSDISINTNTDASVHIESTTAMVRTLKEQGKKPDCKLTFNMGRNAATGQAHLAGLTMGSLEQLLALHDNGVSDAMQRCTVQLVWTGSTDGTTTNKPRPVLQTEKPKHNGYGNSQPVYELQLVVWPTDIEDVAELDVATKPTTMPSTTPPTTTAATPTMLPLYEDQLVVFPQMDFEEENLDYFFDDDLAVPATVKPSPTTTTTTTTATTTTTTPSTTTATDSLVYVVQDYHVVHPNGTTEYKLVLSNGLVNYKKMYTKLVGEQVVNVQEGYDSVPIPGREHQYQTQYYIADELGYNVYKIEHNYRAPELPNYLHYKAKNVATKAPKM